MAEEAMEIEFDEDTPETPEAEEQKSPEEEPEQKAEPKQEEAEEDPDKVEFDERQQAKVNEIIGKKTAKQREAERQAEEYKKRLDELESKLPKQERPEIPEIPDRDDPEFDQKVKARDKAIEEAAAYDASERLRSEQELQEQQQHQQQAMQKFQSSVDKYNERAQTLGIDQGELVKAGETLQDFGYNFGPMAMAQILDDPMGPQIFVHLSKNPTDAEKLQSLPDYKKAVFIENTLKQAAQKGVKKINPPNDPPDHLDGKGAPEDEGGPPGVVYE